MTMDDGQWNGVRRRRMIRRGKGGRRGGEEEQYMTDRNLYLKEIIDLMKCI